MPACMRWIGGALPLAVVVLLQAHASAQPRVAPPAPAPNRKPALATFTPQQLEWWGEAMMMEKRGDLDGAASKWETIVRSEPNANGYWNLADVKIRHERYHEAIRALESYVKLPEADVAAGQALIKKLKTMPYRGYFSAIEAGGVIFVDGKKVSATPVTIEFPDGEYAIHWIGPRGYDDTILHAKAGGDDLKRMGQSDKEPTGGNVAIAIYGSVSLSREWEYKGNTFWVDRRFDLPPGRYDIPLYVPNRACSNIVFDVPRDGMVFVFVKAERTGRDCSSITVTTTKVKL
jgi:hypothetical protein